MFAQHWRALSLRESGLKGLTYNSSRNPPPFGAQGKQKVGGTKRKDGHDRVVPLRGRALGTRADGEVNSPTTKEERRAQHAAPLQENVRRERRYCQRRATAASTPTPPPPRTPAPAQATTPPTP